MYNGARGPVNSTVRLVKMKYSEERKSKESIYILSKILCEWDPIGVMDDPDWPRDEYDSYIPAITLQLDKNTNDIELAKLLSNITNEYMSITSSHSHNIAIAKKLINHWQSYAIS
jgi:hypothetical protein